MLGFLNINKPSGITAHDVVARVRRILKTKQVGHGGTLDPMAVGVLPVGVGKACRLLRFLPSTKVYVAEILLGTDTTTDDIEGEVISSAGVVPAEEDVTRELQSLSGPQMQVPPAFSAIKIQGQRLYSLARQGNAPRDIPARAVTIYKLEILALALPVVRVRVECSAGTYIRSIARDLGKRLSCGGCLQSLVREASGPFHLSEALTLDELKDLTESSSPASALLSPVTVLDMAQVALDNEQASRLLKGQRVRVFAADEYVLVTSGGHPIAVCRTFNEGWLQPEVVIADGDQVD